MRISDWSSDVCSSDLLLGARRRPRAIGAEVGGDGEPGVLRQLDQFGGLDAERAGDAVHPAEREGAGAGFEAADRLRGGRRVAALRDPFLCQALGAAPGADNVNHALVPITNMKGVDWGKRGY